MSFVQLLQTAALVRVQYLETCGSTNAEMQRLVAATPQLAPLLLVTAAQTSGRGRQGRQWQESPGNSLATSYFLPSLPPGAAAPTWIPLLAGVALVQALQKWVPAQLKWPNDILVPLHTAGVQRQSDDLATQRGGFKLAGILCEQTASGYIIGAGINLLTPVSQLPPGAISLRSCGAIAPEQMLAALADQLLALYVQRLQELLATATRQPERLPEIVAAQLATLGQPVRAIMPDGATVTGFAQGLGAYGELILQQPDGTTVAIAAADIEHLRVGA